MANAKTANNLGIDSLKKVLAFLLLTSGMIVDLVRNFSYTRALSLAFHIGENLDIVSIGKEALAEFRDLSVAESQDLSDYLGQEFDIENDQLEARIEEGINLIPEGYGLLKMNIAYYQKVTGFVGNWKQPEPEAIPRLEQALRNIDLPTLRKEVKTA